MSSIAFGPRRLGHVNLWVADLEKSIEVYQNVFGLELVRRERAIKIAFHSNGNTHHDVGIIEVSKGVDRIGRDGRVQIPKTRGIAVGLNHLGWEMESEADLVAAYSRAPSTLKGAMRTVDHLISHSVYVSDPEGNSHEFYADALRDWRSIYNLDREDEVTGSWDPSAAVPNPAPNYDAAPSFRRVDHAALHPKCISGATIAVRDLKAMTKFFVDVAGLEYAGTDRDSGEAVFAGAVGRHELRLKPVDASTPPGLHMVRFDLMEEFDFDLVSARCKEAALAAPSLVEVRGRKAVRLHDRDGFAYVFSNPSMEKDHYSVSVPH